MGFLGFAMKSLWDQNQGLELGLAAERASLCGGRTHCGGPGSQGLRLERRLDPSGYVKIAIEHVHL